MLLMPDKPSKLSINLISLANHLTQVHELTELERKYWLQFAKLQNTSAILVYDKVTEPKIMFL